MGGISNRLKLLRGEDPSELESVEPEYDTIEERLERPHQQPESARGFQIANNSQDERASSLYRPPLGMPVYTEDGREIGVVTDLGIRQVMAPDSPVYEIGSTHPVELGRPGIQAQFEINLRAFEADVFVSLIRRDPLFVLEEILSRGYYDLEGPWIHHLDNIELTRSLAERNEADVGLRYLSHQTYAMAMSSAPPQRYQDISMGCRVENSLCTICGQRACDHLGNIEYEVENENSDEE